MLTAGAGGRSGSSSPTRAPQLLWSSGSRPAALGPGSWPSPGRRPGRQEPHRRPEADRWLSARPGPEQRELRGPGAANTVGAVRRELEETEQLEHFEWKGAVRQELEQTAQLEHFERKGGQTGGKV